LMRPRVKGRILIAAPVHDLLLVLYTFMALLIVIPTWDLVVAPLLRRGDPWLVTAAITARILLAVSPVASLVNIIITEKPRGKELVIEARVQYIYGLPIVVPQPVIVERKTVIAANLGGAIIPVIVAMVSLAASYEVLGPVALDVAAKALVATSLVTFAFSRAVPGVGIVVPALIPPLTAALAVILQVGLGPAAAGIAYFAGTLGSLIGADVLRLLKDMKKLDAPIISIGGAGVFDGVYLSGVLAALLAL